MERVSKKRESGVSKIVGAEAAEELALLNFFKREFEEEKKDPAEKEHPKELDDLIPIINAHLKEFLEYYGINSIDIPAKNIHIVDQSKLTPQQIELLKQRPDKTNGLYVPETQLIAMFLDYSEGGKLAFLQTLVHEVLHVNSFLSFQKLRGQEAERGYKLTARSEAGEEETISLGLRRTGFRIRSRSGNVYFYDLDESIITELTMRFDWKYFPQLPQLAGECQRRQEILEGGSRRLGKSIEKLRREIANVTTNRLEDGRWVTTLKGYSWDKERAKFNKLIDDLYEKNESEFSSREEVFDLFARAVMTERLLPVARLVEKTFGKGSFRKIGEGAREKG